MKLTNRQREILEGLASDDDDMDLVQDGRQVWFGDSRTNAQMIVFLLNHVLVSQEETSAGFFSYEINEWGQRALTDPDFDPLGELYRLERAQREKGVVE